MLCVYRIHSTRAYPPKNTPKHMQISMTLTARMHWTLMWWCRHWKTWNEGIVYLSSRMHRYSAIRLTADRMNRKKADIPVYSFAEHQRQPQTTTLYSPRVLILEGILALDPRVADLLDVKVDWGSVRHFSVMLELCWPACNKIFVEADMDVCLGRRSE